MNVSLASDAASSRSRFFRLRERIGVLPAAVIAGGLSGAIFGGIGGRIVMRIIFLIDDETKGARTDFGDVGEITLGGSFTLLVLCTIAGTFGGVVYAALRRWLPWSGVGRGVAFGLFMMFGPAIMLFNDDAPDLQIFEPILLILAMFIVLVVLYGVSVALVTDRLHAQQPAAEGRRVDLLLRGVWGLAAVWVVFMAISGVFMFPDVEGTCLSADRNGGCAARPPER